MTTTIDPPVTPAPAQAGDVTPVEQVPIRLQRVTAEGVYSLLGSMLGALGLTWLLFERILPLSGALGFWLCAYVVFLVLYGVVGSMQWDARAVANRIIAVLLATTGLFVLAVVIGQIVFVTARGSTAVRHANFWTRTMELTAPLDPLTSGGMIHALVGSLEQLALASIISVPLGLAAALFLVEVGGPLARPVRTIVEAMTALPEIIAGLFVYAFLILSLGLQRGGLAASAALAVMMIPVVTRTAEVIFRLVPAPLKEASYALGGSQVRTVWNVVLPTARSGLSTAVILAMARAVGETSPVLITSGYTSGLNANPFSGPQVSLPLYIFHYVKYPQPQMVARAFGAALALMLMVLVLFVTARIIGGRPPGQLSPRAQRRIARQTRGT